MIIDVVVLISTVFVAIFYLLFLVLVLWFQLLLLTYMVSEKLDVILIFILLLSMVGVSFLVSFEILFFIFDFL